MEIEHTGHDHVALDLRETYRRTNGKLGSRRLLRYVLDTQAAVQMASILIYLAEEQMRDSDEKPYLSIVANREKAEMGANWLKEDMDTIVERTDRRKSRSHLWGLTRRCLEVCEDDGFIEFLMVNLGMWAEQSGDEFATQQAEKALYQLGMVPKETLN